MSEMTFWVHVFERALKKAYGMGAHPAFVSFSKRNKPGSRDLIKNADAYAVAEKMSQDLRDSALWGEDELRQI